MRTASDTAPTSGSTSSGIRPAAVRHRSGAGRWASLRSAVVLGAALATGVALTAAAGSAAAATPTVQQVSTDTLPQYSVNGSSFQLGTEEETDTFAWGSTVVGAFQVGRNASGYGAQAIGWATSSDGGSTWTHGILPGLTASSPNPTSAKYPTVVNQSVAYDARHHEWVIPSVPYVANGTGSFHEKALLISRSTDGTSWNAPITAVSTNVDKAWGVCDNTSTSARYGTCYVAYSQIDSHDALALVHSTDGGATWSAPVTPPSGTSGVPATGYNTNPVVQPSGRVVLVDTLANGANGDSLQASVSDDGGQTWTQPKTFATINYHTPPGNIRAKNKPTVDVDAAGTVYAAWSDCRFHSSCAADDIVYATSTNGTGWSVAKRVAVDPASTAEDKFIPGFGVQPGTSGSGAHLGVAYYTYRPGCTTTANCTLQAQYTDSTDGGATWNPPTNIGAASPASWLPGASSSSSALRMVGDYLSVSFSRGAGVALAPVATAAPSGGTYHEAEWALTVPGPTARTKLAAGAATTITYGSSARLSTKLIGSAGGAGARGQRVTLQGRAATSLTYRTVATATTDRAGHASVAVRPLVDSVYRWTYAGSSVYAASTGSSRSVGVAQSLSAHRSAATVKAGRTVRIYGTVRPTGAGTKVSLQQYVHGAWRTVGASATIKSQTMPDGHRHTGYVLSFRSTHKGAKTLRVRHGATSTNHGGVSGRLTVTVR